MTRARFPRLLSSTRFLQLAVWLVLAALIVSVVVFGVEYVWDRYIHLQDRSPVQVDIEQLEEAVRQEPGNSMTRVALAETYLAAGQYEKALDQADQVLALYPDTAAALLIAGMACAHLDRPEAALAPLQRFVILRQEEPMAGVDQALEAAYYFLGESYVELDRPAEAIPMLEAALAISSTDADALYQLGLAYQATGQAQAAVDAYHQAVRLVPDFLEAYQAMALSCTTLEEPHLLTYARGMEAFCLKDDRKALRYLEQATAALPSFAPAYLGLGLLYERMGRLDEALVALRRAKALDPRDLATQQALGRIGLMMKSQN
ncbi:MAG: tetratricopeptide repeat protein [Anaerolineae bacterium]